MPSEWHSESIIKRSASLDQLQDSLSLLRFACDATSEAMLILDEHHTVCWVNRRSTEWFLAESAHHLIGHNFDSLFLFRHLDQREIPPDDNQHPLQQSVGGEGQMSVLVQVRNSERLPSTPVQHYMVTWQRINQKSDDFTLIIFRDLDPLEKALQHQRSFINRLAHELRTPLAIINGILRRLARAKGLTVQQIRSYGELSSEAKRMSGLVDKLLLLSDLDTDRYPWQLEKRSVCSFLTQWLDHLKEPQRQMICLDLSDAIADITLSLDQAAFSLVFDNLLENSLRFASNGSKFCIRGSLDPQMLVLSVLDQGPPLSINGDASLLFDRFTRLEEHRDPSRSDGVGLGLALVKSLVEGMGGVVKADFSSPNTEDQNCGLQISLFFPRLNQHAVCSDDSANIAPVVPVDDRTDPA
tara:strand:+ start:177 stop:1412 length:1236 start_codon:yes stop_codon:yes gene_type:complete